MPFKLFLLVVFIILITLFAGFNIDNKCDISFVFYQFHQVPVFITVLFSFAAGCIAVLPFTFHRRKQNKKPIKPSNDTTDTNKSKKKSWFGKKKEDTDKAKPQPNPQAETDKAQKNENTSK